MAARKTIVVTGATGIQGSATVHALLGLCCRVRALVRSPNAAASKQLADLGVDMAVGDFDDVVSLERALSGAVAVFLNVSPSMDDPDAETRHAANVIQAATASDSTIRTLVYSSTALTGQHGTFPGWETWNDFARQYWLSKDANERLVRSSGVANWTILRPCTFMTNYLEPLAPFFFPELLSQGVFRTALRPDTPTMLISPRDVGRFAAAALTQPARFGGREIELGAHALTPPEIAAALSGASGRRITAQYMSLEEVQAWVPRSHVIAAQTYFNERSAQMDAASLEKRWGLTLTTFSDFLESSKSDVMKSFNTVWEG